MTSEDLQTVSKLNEEFVLVPESVWLLIGIWYGVTNAVEVCQLEGLEAGGAIGYRAVVTEAGSAHEGDGMGTAMNEDLIGVVQVKLGKRLQIADCGGTDSRVRETTINNFENQLGAAGRRLSPNTMGNQVASRKQIAVVGDECSSLRTPE